MNETDVLDPQTKAAVLIQKVARYVRACFPTWSPGCQQVDVCVRLCVFVFVWLKMTVATWHDESLQAPGAIC